MIYVCLGEVGILALTAFRENTHQVAPPPTRNPNVLAAHVVHMELNKDIVFVVVVLVENTKMS